MARKKLNMITLHSWQECDAALRSIGENLRDIAAIENVMNEQIASAKAAATDKAAPLKEQVAEMELALRDYAQTHRDDMDGKKSKTLNFGSVGFRKSTRITLPKAPAKVAEIVRQLLERGMSDCVKQAEPKIDKGILGKYPPADIIAVGAGVKVLDTFWYEPDREKLERN